MDKTDLLRRMREAHAPIEAATATISDDALDADAPGMDGWSRKDVLAHIEWWHRHSTAVIAGVRSGTDPYPDTGESIDTLNARVLAENRGRSAADVREGEAASFRVLAAAVEAATDRDLFDKGVVPWMDSTAAEVVGWDTFEHYPEHVPHLTAG